LTPLSRGGRIQAAHGGAILIRLYLPFFLALLFLAVPKESVGQAGNLAQISALEIFVTLTKTAKELKLSESKIKDQALVLLRSKLPRLEVKDSALYDLGVILNLQYMRLNDHDKPVGYSGYVVVAVNAYVNHPLTNKPVYVLLWHQINYVAGPVDNPFEYVDSSLDDLFTAFAADWYRDNPSK